jgi:group II intron reverse transcriptase/maturase
MATRRGGITMETKLARIADTAKNKPKERFTSLVHLLNMEMLENCHHELKNKKSTGIDEMTKETYNENLDENLKSLHYSLKKMRYKPKEVRRTHIPKVGSSKKRPLGIPTYEDKIVQLAVSKILVTIYEQDFLDFSYGFRPNRSPHDALRTLNNTIMSKKINWIVDADIEGFFDNVNHVWMQKALEVRIADRNLIRIIMRMLKSGVMENGVRKDTRKGTPQGGVISPVLANIYLHYVLDLWFEVVVKKECDGSAHIVRYADDFVCCFQKEDEALAFYSALIKRLQKFGLRIAADKTLILEFGQFAWNHINRRGLKKPATFDFLGFTHYCGFSRNGKFRVKRRTSRKKFAGAVARLKMWLKQNRNQHVRDIIAGMCMRLNGHFRYFGITDNGPMLGRFLYIARGLLLKWVNRRSQRNSYTWENFEKLLSVYPLPKARVTVSMW